MLKVFVSCQNVPTIIIVLPDMNVMVGNVRKQKLLALTHLIAKPMNYVMVSFVSRNFVMMMIVPWVQSALTTNAQIPVTNAKEIVTEVIVGESSVNLIWIVLHVFFVKEDDVILKNMRENVPMIAIVEAMKCAFMDSVPLTDVLTVIIVLMELSVSMVNAKDSFIKTVEMIGTAMDVTNALMVYVSNLTHVLMALVLKALNVVLTIFVKELDPNVS